VESQYHETTGVNDKVNDVTEPGNHRRV
jgi:hypothetical protein